MVAVYIVVTMIAYLLGSISFSVIISKKLAGFDVREKGSGNAGSTNVLRTVGKKAAALTLLCDILKGVVAVGVAWIASLIWKETSGALYIPNLLWFQRRKRSCNSTWCTSHLQLANWTNLFGICSCDYGSYQNCITWLDYGCYLVPSFNIIH